LSSSAFFFFFQGCNQIGHPQKDLVKFDHKQYHSTWATLAQIKLNYYFAEVFEKKLVLLLKILKI